MMLNGHSEMVLYGVREEGSILVAIVPRYPSAFLDMGWLSLSGYDWQIVILELGRATRGVWGYCTAQCPSK